MRESHEEKVEERLWEINNTLCSIRDLLVNPSDDIPTTEKPDRVERPPQDEHGTTVASGPATPEGGEPGFSIEHILLSVTVIHTNKIMQYDGTCAMLIQKHLAEYGGVVRVHANALYDHCRTDVHLKCCSCGYCKPQSDTA